MFVESMPAQGGDRLLGGPYQASGVRCVEDGGVGIRNLRQNALLLW